jgi:hypothetical protein
MSLTYSGVEPQPSLAWSFESSNVDSVTGLTPSAQVSPGPAQLQGSAALVTNAPTSNTAASFPGSVGSYMTLGTTGPTTFDTSVSNTFMEAWVYLNTGQTGNRRIYSKYSDIIGPINYSFRVSGAIIGLTNGSSTVSHQTALSTGVWTHIAFSLMTNGTANVFVNGVVNTTATPLSVSATSAWFKAGWFPWRRSHRARRRSLTLHRVTSRVWAQLCSRSWGSLSPITHPGSMGRVWLF